MGTQGSKHHRFDSVLVHPHEMGPQGRHWTSSEIMALVFRTAPSVSIAITLSCTRAAPRAGRLKLKDLSRLSASRRPLLVLS